MRNLVVLAAGAAAVAFTPLASAQIFYHVSSRVLAGGTTNEVFLFDATGTWTGSQYTEGGTAAGDAWGYRDGTEDGTHVYFGWGQGLFMHDGLDGGNPVQLYTNGGPNGTWRALAYDASGDGGNGSIWSASFGSSLVEADLSGGILTTYPVGGWSLYGLDLDETDGNLWGHDALGAVIKIDTATGTIIPGAGWATGFANLAAQGGLSGHHDGTGLLAAVSQGTPDELGVYDPATGTLIAGPWDIDVQTGENGALGVAVFMVGGGPCYGDINEDGVVDVLDLLAVLAAWGPCAGCPADLNGDGVVNVLDLLDVLAAWGPCPVDLGACCFYPSGDCADMSASDCVAQGGSWQGPGSDCASTICPTPGPGDTISTAIPVPLPLPYASSGDTSVGYNDDYDEVCPYPDSQSNDVVYAYAANFTGTISITLCGMSAYDTKLYVYDNPNPVTYYACNDDACTSGSGQNFVSELLNMNVTSGTTYYIVVDGYDSNNGFYTIDITTP